MLKDVYLDFRFSVLILGERCLFRKEFKLDHYCNNAIRLKQEIEKLDLSSKSSEEWLRTHPEDKLVSFILKQDSECNDSCEQDELKKYRLKKIADNPEEGSYKDFPVGWICPRCGKGLSPFISSCPCISATPIVTYC